MHRGVDGHVRLRARVRLDVGVLGAEQRLCAVDGQLLDLVDDLAAAVVAPARIALGVLVGGHAADRLEDRGPGEVLGGDQLDLTALALELAAEQLGDLRIDVGERPGAQLVQGLLVDRHAADGTRGHSRAASRLPRRPRPPALIERFLKQPVAEGRERTLDRLGRGRCALADHARLGAGEVDHRRRRPRQLAAVDDRAGGGADLLRDVGERERIWPAVQIGARGCDGADQREHLGARCRRARGRVRRSCPAGRPSAGGSAARRFRAPA